MFKLVEFTDESECAVVPSNWLVGKTHAVWPNTNVPHKIKKAVTGRESPAEDWTTYPIKLIYWDDSYEKCRSKLTRAEFESDLQTDVEEPKQKRLQPDVEEPKQKRKRWPTLRYDSDTEEDVPLPASRGKVSTKTTSTHTVSAAEPSEALPLPPARVPIMTSPPQTNPQTAPSIFPQTAPSIFPQTAPSTPSASTPSTPSASTPSTPSASSTTPRSVLAQRSSVRPGTGEPRQITGAIRGQDIFNAQVLTLLTELRTEQRHQSAILAKLVGSDHQDVELPEGLEFPVSSEQEFVHLEDRLGDATVKKVVVEYLSAIGGSTIKIMIRRLLKHVLSNSIARIYNWTGAKDKKPFQHLQTCSAIFRAVRKAHGSAHQHETELYIKDWLRNAKDRDGGRSLRRTISPKPASCTRIDYDTDESNPVHYGV